MEQIREKPRLFAATHPLEALTLLVLFACLLLFLKSILEVYTIPYGIDFGEGYLANMSLELVRGQNPYHSIDSEPWIVSSYPPLFPLLNGMLMTALGRSLLAGRFIATASLIGIIATSIVLLRKLGVGPVIALLAAGMMLVFPWSVKWAQVVRVDTLGILFSVGGMYLWLRSEKTNDAIVAAVLLTAAVFTKHSFLAAPLSCLVYGFISRDRRRFLFLLLLAVLIGGGYALINLITGGGLFNHLFTYTANKFHFWRMTTGLGMYFQKTWILQVVAISSLVMPGVASDQRRMLGWYYFFAHLTLLTYGFTGSDSNYFIEPLLSVSLLAAFAFEKFNSDISEIKPAPFSMKTLGFLLLLAIVVTGRFIETSEFKVHRMNADRLQGGKDIIRLCATREGDVLCEDASFTFLAGKPVVIQPYIMTLLQRTGKWDEEPFLQTIRDRRYDLVILRVDLNDPYNTEQRGGAWEIAGFDRWTDGMEDAIRQNYELSEPIDAGVGNTYWFIYQRRQELPGFLDVIDDL